MDGWMDGHTDGFIHSTTHPKNEKLDVDSEKASNGWAKQHSQSCLFAVSLSSRRQETTKMSVY